MQKTPIHYKRMTAATQMVAVVTVIVPFMISSAIASEGYSGMSGLAQREITRRQQAVADSDRMFIEGRDAYAKADFQMAVDKFRAALSNLPDAPTLADRRASYTDHLSDASVALAQQYRKMGKYDEARALLDGVLSPQVDPQNAAAKTELGYLDDPIRTNPALTYEHTKNIDEVRRALYMAQGNFDLGKFDAAKANFEAVLRIDPYNTAARRGMEKIAATKSDYYRAAYDHTRAEMLMQVDEAWALSVPADIPDLTLGSDLTNSPSNGVAYISEKLRRIVIPSLNFEEGSSLEETIDFLRLRARELDTLELDPERKGVNIVIQTSRTNAVGGSAPDGAAGEAPLLGVSDLGALRLSSSLRIRNVPLATALEYIGELVNPKLRFKVDDFAVNLVPQTDTGEDNFTRTFRVPPDFATNLHTGGGASASAEVDPFGSLSSGGGDEGRELLKPRPSIIELLKQNGILFSAGSSATLGASGTLLVTNTSAELDKIEQLIDATSSAPKQVKITTKFVEISQENNDELGFDWIIGPFGLSANNVFGTGGTVGNGIGRNGSDFISPVNGTTIPGIPSGNTQVSNIITSGLRSGDTAVSRNSLGSLINNTARTAQNINVAPGILGITGLFSDAQIQVIMRGLSQKKGTDLMTAPSITARSGQKATIEVIREFIYPTEYEPPELPAASTSTNTTGGATAPIATPATPTAFETRNLGVTLEIEPTIGENNFVIDLRFLPEIVEFEGFINYGSPIQSNGVTITENRIEMPVFSKRSVNTSLTIYDGYTVAVGGLMREDVQGVHDKVPILGDIPLIGRLFQSESENRIKSNLIIFVTAQIIDATGRPLRGDSGGTAIGLPETPVFDGGVLPSTAPQDLPE